MRNAIVASAIFLTMRSVGVAAFADFSDFDQTTAFEVGEVFESGGIQFKAIQFIGVSHPAEVVVTQFSRRLLPGPGVEFLLPAGTREVSLRYSDGASIAMALNSDAPVAHPGPGAGFSFLDATSVAGVSIDIDVTYQIVKTRSTGPIIVVEEGFLHLRGPISSLVIAGLELNIDDVTVLVPEPAAASLAACAVFALIASRRRMKTA